MVGSRSGSIVCILVTVSAVACSSGAGGAAPPGAADDASTVARSCTGPVPEHATLCPDADKGLTTDAPRVLVATCTCDAACRAIVPCSYSCSAGYVAAADVCQPLAPSSSVAFIDDGDGTVTVADGHARLVWPKSASCAGAVPWFSAQSWSDALAAGTCGLHDGSVPGDWRLPTHVELMNLAADLASPAYESAGRPFTGIATGGYWSSFSTCTYVFGVVDVNGGQYFDRSQDLLFNVWPVRPAPSPAAN